MLKKVKNEVLKSEGQRMKRVNIALDDETHTKAKIIALLKNLTLNEYFKGIIEDAVSKDQELINKKLPERLGVKKGDKE